MEETKEREIDFCKNSLLWTPMFLKKIKVYVLVCLHTGLHAKYQKGVHLISINVKNQVIEKKLEKMSTA